MLLVLAVLGLLWWRGRRERLREERAKQTALAVTAKISTSAGGGSTNARSLAEALRRDSERCWVTKGRSVTIAGHLIVDGMVYVGSRLARQDGYGQDNCLIDPDLPVAEKGPNIEGAGVSYYPSYTRLDPASRLAYLEWLASGKRDPDAYVGYVFLYFYGLERRLMLDGAGDEREALIGEVERLRGVYAGNGSFAGYSRQLLDAFRLLKTSRKFYEETPPLERRGWEVPLIVRLAIGQMAAEGKPVPADWMLAWLMTDPMTRLRKPASRAQEEFRQLFRLRFAAKYPDGLKIHSPKPRLRYAYRAAGATFRVDLREAIGDLPEIGSMTGPLNKVREIAEGCVEALDLYSRLIGRHPEARGSFQAIALLPPELAERSEGDAVRNLHAVLDRIVTEGTMLLPAKKLIAHVTGVPAVQVGKAMLRSCADTLAHFGVGLAPDPRAAIQLPKADEPVVLFKLPGKSAGAVDEEPYRRALLFLSLAAYVAHAEGAVARAEREWLSAFVRTVPGLDDTSRVRLGANLEWMLAVRPELGALRSRLAPLPTEERHELGRVALAVACADGGIGPAELKAVQRIYKALGLDEARVFHDVHALMAEMPAVDQPVPIKSGRPAPEGYAIPKQAPALPEERVRLDAERIRQISENTERVNAILAKVFNDEDAERDMVGAQPTQEAPAPPPPITREPGAFDGLDPRYGAFLAELLTRSEWPRQDLDALARSFDLMTDGAVEAINEWAFDRYSDALLEDGELMNVNGTLLEQMRAKEAVHA